MNKLAQKQMKQPEQTKELLAMRKFMSEKGDNYILSLMERRFDEYEYESWEEYADAYKNFFSQMGETVVVNKDKKHPRKNNNRFIIKVQLNDTQYYNIEVTKVSMTKYLKLGNYKQDLV